MTDSIERGAQADALLRSDIFKTALDNLDAEYHRLWRQAKTVESREDLHRYVTLIGKLVSDLRNMVVTGELERKRQEELSGEKKGIHKWLT